MRRGTDLESTVLDPIQDLFGVLCEFLGSADECSEGGSGDLETLGHEFEDRELWWCALNPHCQLVALEGSDRAHGG